MVAEDAVRNRVKTPERRKQASQSGNVNSGGAASSHSNNPQSSSMRRSVVYDVRRIWGTLPCITTGAVSASYLEKVNVS